MTDPQWQQARLIPTSGINGAEEQERRAASAFLAVLPAVKEFGRTLLSSIGAPAGHLETFVEVPLKLGDKAWRPDGLLRVTRGSKTWTALVEVKTGKDLLTPEQVEAYLDIARQEKFDALVTISNQIPSSPGIHPTTVDRRKLRSVGLHHWSWAYLVSTAVTQKEHRGVSDPDQAWILGELIRYLEHPKSGALSFDDMGSSWVTIREQVANGTLRAGDKEIPAVTGRFDALLTYAALQLGRRLGSDVNVQLTRKEIAEPGLRHAALKASLVGDGSLSGAIKVPGTIGEIVVTADLRASKVGAHVDIDAPKEGRSTTRINWLLRQIKEAPGNLRVEAFAHGQRGSGAAELLSVVREQPDALIAEPSKELRAFRVAVMAPMGTKRGRGRGSFIDSVLEAVDSLYEEVVQNIKPWSAAPPKIKDVGRELPTDDEAARAGDKVEPELPDEPENEPADKVTDFPTHDGAPVSAPINSSPGW